LLPVPASSIQHPASSIDHGVWCFRGGRKPEINCHFSFPTMAPDPVTVAPLVPRANKAKKKRPGFRPVGKSSKTNSSSKPPSKQKAAQAPQRKEPPPTSEPQVSKDDEEPSSKSTPDEVPEEQAVQEEKVENRVKFQVETQEETQVKQPAAPITEPETPKAPPPKVSTTARKRKQSTSIATGILRSTTATPVNNNHVEPSSATANKRRSVRSASEASTVKFVSGNAAEDTAPRASSDRTSSSRALSRKSTALVVANASALSVAAAPPQDRDILERMVAENTEGARLNSFCSTFKGTKESRRRNKGPGSKTAPAGNAPNSTNHSRQRGSHSAASNNTNNNHSRNSGSQRNASDAAGAPVVQVIDGEIVLQESSLMVPGQRRTVQEVEEEFQDVIEEDAQLAIVGASYNSFVNRKGPQHWTLQETKRFFEALRQLGTDFCSMEAFFENRSRKQLKRKYRTELIRNPALVEMALDPRNKTKVGEYEYQH
jgi:transcription factor TFIIIB component B''